MQNSKTLETALMIAGVVAIVAGVVVAILNGQGIVSFSERVPDYLMIGGVIIYLCGRQLRNHRVVLEDNEAKKENEEN